MMSRSARHGAIAILAIVITGCGGGATSPSAGTNPTPDALATVAAPTSGRSASVDPSISATGTPPTVGYVPGSVGYRVVHLFRRPDGSAPDLDIYGRSSSGTDAFIIQAGVTHGSIVGYVHPPDGGGLVVTEAGSGVPECVTNCTDSVVDTRDLFGEGERRTIVIHPESPNFITGDTPSDLAGVFEYWEDPDADSVGQLGNALMPADPAMALVFVSAIAVDEARFGIRVAFAGEAGCQDSVNAPGALLGGNQIHAFGFETSADVTLHENGDTACSETPVGGPFALDGGAGSRAHLILHGTLGDMEATSLPIDPID